MLYFHHVFERRNREMTSGVIGMLAVIAILLSDHGFFAILIGGLILAGILACTMSTSDSQLLAASSGISKNLIQDCFGAALRDKQSILLARLTVIEFGIAALGGAFAIYELLPAFFAGLIINILVSLFTKAPEQDIIDTFEQVNEQ